MDELYSISYYAPEQDVPAKLPSREEIHHATDVLSDSASARVVGVAAHFVVKYGQQVSLQEGLNMVFLKKAGVVPVPKVFAIYEMTDDKTNYIVMERVVGDRLDLVWSSLKLAEKEAIASQLRALFTELRRMPSPGGYCSLNRQPLRDHMLRAESSAESLEGPFETEGELNDAMIRKYESSSYFPSSHKAAFYRRALASILTGHEPTFTHGNLQRKKIFWSRQDGRVTLIGWEFAGWYPSYWEYANAVFLSGWNDDWHQWIDYSLDWYKNEWVWMQMLMLELWS